MSKFPIKYRNCSIDYWCKPIPIRNHDYQWSHEDFDGAPDGYDMRQGTAPSIEACKADIDEMYENGEMS